MKKLILLTIVTTISVFASSAKADTIDTVRPYVNKNGKLIQQHLRTHPDHTKFNNWSTKGRTNPFTGKKGTKNQ